MFFEKNQQIPQIIQHTECSIFALPPDVKLKLPNAIYLRPSDDKKTPIISVEQIRDFCTLTTNRETRDRFFVITPADAMNEAAQNAFLKTLEEPHPFCHFVLITTQPNLLLPTIQSRSQIFYPHLQDTLEQPPNFKPKTLGLAKKLIAATPAQLVDLANELTKSKTQARESTLEAVSAAIELLYKSYFKTGNQKFLTKLNNFLTLHKNLSQNGHIKLHLVADLL